VSVQPSSPEAEERLQAAMARHITNPDQRSLREFMKAVWDAYPLTDADRVELVGLGAGDWVENFDAVRAREGTI
jgi:hypothetical protein